MPGLHAMNDARKGPDFYETETSHVEVVEGKLGVLLNFKARLNGTTKLNGEPMDGVASVEGKVTHFVSTPSRGTEYGVQTPEGHRIVIAVRDAVIQRFEGPQPTEA